ncbi:MAG TPA: arsenate reductase ArsC [Ktedonobacterales bacterium]|nr:arsenate reductase ArsC [Ktedonobacterales bacterium]
MGDSVTNTETRPMRVLFLCTHNSSRSQMAEGYLRARGGERYEAFSAGTQARGINPLAIKALAERGIDISDSVSHRSQTLQEFLGRQMDLVVTVCDEATEECPLFPGARHQEHWSFPDPSAATGTEEQRLAVFRQVRDTIEARLRAWLAGQPAS